MSQKIILNDDELIQRLKTMKIDELATYFNVSRSTIRRNLKRLHLSAFKRVFDESEFMRLYNEGKDDNYISKQLGCSNTTISNYRNKLQLPPNYKTKHEYLKQTILNSTKSKELLAKELNVDISVIDYFKETANIDIHNYEISDYEFQILIGGLLGDASLSENKRKNFGRYTFAHSEKQKNYCIWKAKQLQNLVYYPRVFRPNYRHDKRTNKTYISYFCHSKECVKFKTLRDRWYNNHVKHICWDDLSKLNALGLAIWFMDDGYKSESGYYIATLCFSKEDLQLIKKYFSEKWNIEITITKVNEVYIPAKYRKHFTEIIKPYIHSDCKYKLLE